MKIAGMKNRSPETYPSAPIKSNVLETLPKVGPGSPVAINSSSPTSLLSSPISFTPAVSAKALVLFSGVLQTASPSAAATNVEVIVDGTPVYTYAVDVKTAGAPVPFGIAFDVTGGLSASPHTIDIQAQATSGTSQAIDGSAVVVVTSA
jgi:hypothetical protein